MINDLATFGFSFLILITMWLRYTQIMSVFPLDNARVIRLNILLLFCVSVEPFLFNLVRKAPEGVANLAGYDNTTSTLYALDLGAMFLIMGGFTLTLASEERNLIPKELTHQYRISGAGWFICGVLYLLSALPIFFTLALGLSLPLRYYIWAAPLVLIWALRRQRSKDETDVT